MTVLDRWHRPRQTFGNAVALIRNGANLHQQYAAYVDLPAKPLEEGLQRSIIVDGQMSFVRIE
jgi:hypothetical protein